MSVTRLAIENDRVTAMVMIVILIGGLVAFQNIPRAKDPAFVVRWAVVETDFPGASPERVEQLVTDRIEKAIQEIPELDFMNSMSKTGYSNVSLMLKEQVRDPQPVWDSLRRKMERLKRELPEGAIGPRVNDELDDVFGIQFALIGEGYSYAELREVADEVRDELLHIDDVAKVDIVGAQEERVFVEYNNARLSEFGLSPQQLVGMLQNRNIIIPGGDIIVGNERIVLEPSGNFESVADLRRTVVSLPNSRDVISLEHLVDIRRGYVDPPQMMMRFCGEPCLGLAVSMREGGDITRLGKVVRERMEQLEATYPIGIEFGTVLFLPDEVEEKVDQLTSSVLQSIGIVLVVMLVALGLRTGLLVATLIPMAMLMTFIFMASLGIHLHQVSLASLIIALGMLVDNAIVMSESIMVQMAGGKSRVQAAVDSARELRAPLLSSSLTTSAAFLPIFLAESMVGEFCRSLFSVTTITLLCSWALALTMIPMLCSRFMKVKATTGGGFDSGLYRLYRRFLLWLLKNRVLTVVAVVVVFLVAMQGFAFIPALFFPPTDQAFFAADLELPIGTTIERTERVVAEVDSFVAAELRADATRRDGITRWSSFAGGGPPSWSLGLGPKGGSPEYAFMLFHLTTHEILEQTMARVEAFCNARYPDLQITVKRMSEGPPSDVPVEVRVSGRETEVLFSIVEALKAKLADIPGTKLVNDDWGARVKKLLVNINEARARRAGVTNRDIAMSLQGVLKGFVTTEYREEDKAIPITLRSVAADRKDIGKLESLNIYSQATGRHVPLKQVADIELAWEPSKILRYNRYRTVTVSCRKDPHVTAAEISTSFVSWVKGDAETWPPGYTYEVGGEAEDSAEANNSINEKLPIAALIIVLLLVGQFNSFRRSTIILSTIPLGLIGVVVGLLIGRSYFGFMTFLGVISLAGIVINNAIVLLDRIRLESEENGLEPQQAVVEAAQRRLRPILLTTVTTIGGLTPLLISGGGMWETMALAIMFGLLFATGLTLGLVPVLYSLLFRVSYKDYGV
jgi:multidrug efflux pump